MHVLSIIIFKKGIKIYQSLNEISQTSSTIVLHHSLHLSTLLNIINVFSSMNYMIFSRQTRKYECRKSLTEIICIRRRTGLKEHFRSSHSERTHVKMLIAIWQLLRNHFEDFENETGF